MKNPSIVLMLTVSLSGCAAVGSGTRYVNAIDNVRNSSMSTVAGYAQTVKSFLSTGTQEQAIEKAKQVVASSLKDPDSAQFRNVRIANYMDGKVVCGEVNGKNSYGGYVGFGPFVASTDSSTLYDRDSQYPDIQSASNAGLNSACN